MWHRNVYLSIACGWVSNIHAGVSYLKVSRIRECIAYTGMYRVYGKGTFIGDTSAVWTNPCVSDEPAVAVHHVPLGAVQVERRPQLAGRLAATAREQHRQRRAHAHRREHDVTAVVPGDQHLRTGGGDAVRQHRQTEYHRIVLWELLSDRSWTVLIC